MFVFVNVNVGVTDENDDVAIVAELLPKTVNSGVYVDRSPAPYEYVVKSP